MCVYVCINVEPVLGSKDYVWSWIEINSIMLRERNTAWSSAPRMWVTFFMVRTYYFLTCICTVQQLCFCWQLNEEFLSGDLHYPVTYAMSMAWFKEWEAFVKAKADSELLSFWFFWRMYLCGSLFYVPGIYSHARWQLLQVIQVSLSLCPLVVCVMSVEGL